VAILTIGGVLAFVSLPEFTLKPLYWASEQFDRSGYLAFFFFQSVFWWALIGGVVAFGMLLLKPRRVIPYGLVSAASFILFGQSWSLDTQAIWYFRELIFVATIPLLYWLFVYLARKRHNKSLKADAVNGAP
jgi:hypothetical protein